MSDAEGLRIAFIGAGMMGEAMIRGLVTRNIVPASQIAASEPRAERRQVMASLYPGLSLSPANAEVIGGADIVVLSIKPQTLPSVIHDIRDHLDPKQLVISIIAGVSLDTLESGTYHPAIVRAMPNTPCLVGEGMIVWVANHGVSLEQVEQTRRIFSALGRELQVSDENYLNMATSINGSGPAYVFLMMEALTDAGVQIGLPRYIAEELVTQTVLGSARLAQETGQHPAALKNQVTSPAGTTAAALYCLEKGGVRSTVAEAITAAYERSIALGKADGAKPGKG